MKMHPLQKQDNRTATSRRNGRAMSPRRIVLTKVWAYFVRYGMLLGIPLPAAIASGLNDSRAAKFLGLGAGCLVFALYYLVGYLLRWTHMYCVYQNANHQKMTPDKVNWSDIRKSDAIGVPLIFMVFGILSVIVALTG